MEYELMHRNHSVAVIDIESDTGFIKRINSVFDPLRLPVGVVTKQDQPDPKKLDEWWEIRAIPLSRDGIWNAIDTLGTYHISHFLFYSYGLSLSDQYWIKPAGSNLNWEEINFFDHPFSEDFGDVLLGESRDPELLRFNTPDLTTNGNLKKRWKIIDEKRCLIKGGSYPFWQEPFCEVIASKLMDKLNIPHISYSLIEIDGEPYSVCEDFITSETELIPAWRILQTKKRGNETSHYQHFVDCCAALGIPDVETFLDRMIVADYLIANEDRHYNNFGAVRNAETLEWIGMAPIYDSGSSLGFYKDIREIMSERDIACKPFRNSHENQIKLVRDFSWIDCSSLEDIRSIVYETFSENSAVFDERRIEIIANSFTHRINKLKEIIDMNNL